MRKILAIGLCVAFLAFGSFGGQAHVHGSAGHHEAARGLHLDHAHLGHSDSGETHGRHRHDGPVSPPVRTARADDHDVHHHAGDAVYLSHVAVRSVLSDTVAPAVVSDAPVIASVLLSSGSAVVSTCRPRAPPGKTPPRLRAPPA